MIPLIHFRRQLMLSQLQGEKRWDVVIIGGGATGLGCALDAASRGYSTLLLEAFDFAKGTSSRSTKLVHGGVRYLAQGNIGLVYGALHERGILRKNAPHVVKPLSFIIPCYTFWDRFKYSAGLKFYDLLSGTRSFGKSTFLNAGQTAQQLPNISVKGLLGGVEYFDGQFDDSRLAINIAQTAADHGATLLNYCRVIDITKGMDKVNGVRLVDTISGKEYIISAQAVINATGVFVDDVLKLDNSDTPPMVAPSQGVHLVVDKRFSNGSSAIMIPKTSDGRVLFALPWHEHLLIGTTDTPVHAHSPEPVALESEIRFILDSLRLYLADAPGRKDVSSVFAGLRPLAAASGKNKSTKEISRDHKLVASSSGLITITGGKWTTYRKMAQETVDLCASTAGLDMRKSTTENIRLHGYAQSISHPASHLSVYGADEKNITALILQDPSLSAKLDPAHPFMEAEVIWSVRNEMAVTVEDVLARRIRLLFLDSRAAVRAAPRVAELMMKELHLSENWKETQLVEFNIVAKNYLIN